MKDFVLKLDALSTTVAPDYEIWKIFSINATLTG